MKITKIILGCRRTGTVYGEMSDDYCLYLFRTPVIFNLGGNDKLCTGSSVIMYTGSRRQYFRPQDGKTMKYDIVQFKPSSADKQYAASMNIPFDVPVDLADDFVIASLIKNMKVRSGINGRRNSEFMELSMRMILICMGDMCSSEPVQQTVRDIPKYHRFKALREDIYDDPMRDWSVDELCTELDISRTYFHRIYLNAFGVTFLQDVIESRLVYAEELLSETELSVSSVAEQCGYESDSYFMRQFKQHRGCTPTEFRKRVAMKATALLLDDGSDS
ncbi:MAG: helix-turn-helix transcriptional regulator [Ruminococcus sp.]|nr:helix-turn-helix transcriptional regulator [Ruminococcus sp.]